MNESIHACMNKIIIPDKVKLYIFQSINQTFSKANELFTTEFMAKNKTCGVVTGLTDTRFYQGEANNENYGCLLL